MKVLHLPASVGGNAYGLAQGERKLGLDSRVLSLHKSKFNYPTDILIDLANKNLCRQLIGRIQAFLRYRTGFDIYHFNFGSSLLHAPQYKLNLFDLPFYDSKAKKIFMYQGCDARQKYPSIIRNLKSGTQVACFKTDCYEGMCNSGKLDLWRQRAIEKAAKYADHFFALNPDLMYFLPKNKTSFLPYTIANFSDLSPKETPFFVNDKIRIAHAPTQRATKGTQYVLQALEQLKTEFGNKLEIIIIENLPQEQALATYKTADLFIDQLLVGWYGAVAVEAMRLGVPVAVYINPEHLQFVPKEMVADLPFLQVNIFNLKEKIRNFILQRDMVFELSTKAKAFVEKWHDPVKVAEQVCRVYQG